jgi:hypothetical protein
MLPGVLDPASLAPLEAACERLLATGVVRDVTEEAVRLATPARADAIFGAPSCAATLAGRATSSSA